MNTINFTIIILLLIISTIRFIKRALDFGILIIPPLFLSYYFHIPLSDIFITWFLILDFSKNNSSILFLFFKHLFSPTKNYKTRFIGKLFNLLITFLTFLTLLLLYLKLFELLVTSNNILTSLSNCIYFYIFIYLVKNTYLFFFNKSYKNN